MYCITGSDHVAGDCGELALRLLAIARQRLHRVERRRHDAATRDGCAAPATSAREGAREVAERRADPRDESAACAPALTREGAAA